MDVVRACRYPCFGLTALTAGVSGLKRGFVAGDNPSSFVSCFEK